MKFSNLTLCSFLATLLLRAVSALAGNFLIHDGDNVVFLGDSITEQRLYTTYIEAYALTRHPNWKLTFRNVGWGSETSWLRQRTHPDEKMLFAADDVTQQKMVQDSVGRGLARDVLPLKPTLVMVNFGMNDHFGQPFREDLFRAFVRSQTEIAHVLKAKGARVVFLTSQPIEDRRPDPDKEPHNQSLRKFFDGLKEVAAKTDAAFVDQFDPYMTILLRERASNPPVYVGGGSDSVHPGPVGQMLMTWALLKDLGATATVSRADINAGSEEVLAAEKCRVGHLKTTGGVVSFDRLDDALSMPIDERAESALKLAPISEELNALELRVSGLAAKNYSVNIDGEAWAKVTATELAKGWNMADTAGPMTKQGQEVLRLIFDKNNLYFHRWREIQLYDFPAWAKGPELEAKRTTELVRLDQKLDEMEQKIDKARKPKPHHFELRPEAD
jgi:lysophospholipase L1-like esterase